MDFSIIKLYKYSYPPSNLSAIKLWYEGERLTSAVINQINEPCIVQVIGYRGVGKNVFARGMSQYSSDKIYITSQKGDEIHDCLKPYVIKTIIIKEVTK